MILAALLQLASQSNDPIVQDARLASKVTIEVPIITLGDVAKRLSTETGVSLTVDDGIQDRKATLFVRGRPARETMEALADTFFLTWNPDGKGYRLTLAKGVADEEAEAVRLDRERMKAKIDDTFAGWRELDSVSLEDQAQQQGKSAKELSTLAGATDQASQDRRAAIRRFLDLSSTSVWSSFAVAYNGHQREVDEDLLAGKTLFASTRPQDDCPKLSASVLQRFGWKDTKFDSAIGLMQIDPASARLRGMYIFMSEHPGKGGPAGTHLLTEDASTFRISKRISTWSTVAESPVADLQLGARPLGNPRLITLTDQLAYVHKRTEVPIVADAYRVPSVVGRQTGDTVGEFAERLSQFSALRFPKGAVVFRSGEGWLKARHRLYWRLDAREPREDSVAPFEDLVAHGKPLSTVQLASLAAVLTDMQMGGLLDGSFPTIVAFPTSQLDAFHTLRVWNALSEVQRAKAQSRDGLGLGDLERTQATLAKTALLNLLWNGPKESQIPLLLGDPAAFATARLFYEEGKAPVQPDFSGFELLNDPSILTGRVPGTAVNFFYGLTMRDAVMDGFTFSGR